MTYANSLGLDPLQMSLPLNMQADMANRVGFQQQSNGVLSSYLRKPIRRNKKRKTSRR